MSIKILGPESFVTQQWKNGGGSTLELLRYPEDCDEYLVRLSIAEVVASGPFSNFPGYQRSICQLEGPAMRLIHPALKTEKKLVLGVPYSFAGDWATECNVDGTARDFNVIWKADRVACEVEFVVCEKEREFVLDSGDANFLYLEKGLLSFGEHGGVRRTLGERHFMIVDRDSAAKVLRLDAGSRVFVVRLDQK